jgi:multidrug efflux system outer membrane protein
MHRFSVQSKVESSDSEVERVVPNALFGSPSSGVERIDPNAFSDSRPRFLPTHILSVLGTTRSTLLSAGALALLLAGCAVGPDYKQPDVATTAPAAFAETGPWKVATPKDDLPKGDWWKIFHDPVLDALETSAASASPTLQAAVARRDQAFAVAGVSRADYFPSLSLDPSGNRTLYSGNRQVPPGASNAKYTTNSFNLPLDLSYELDLWGRVRRSNESARALADASAATYQNVLLGVQADVASAYFTLRSLAVESELVARSIQTRRDALDLVQKRFAGGASAQLDVLRAQTELASAESDALVLDQRRAALRHTLAVLCGQSPESFKVDDSASLPATVPALPIGLPSDVLERRPDVAAAERTLAASNAQIGIAKAAFFPSIKLIGSAGYNSTDLNSLLNSDSRQWSLGPAISLPIFQGGRNVANYDRAKAAYAESVANYRLRVLVAFQEVEDGLSGLRYLDSQAEALGRAVTASRQAASLSTVRYKAGLVSYLEVVDAERTALQNERTATQLATQRLTASILLVKALGGGW